MRFYLVVFGYVLYLIERFPMILSRSKVWHRILYLGTYFVDSISLLNSRKGSDKSTLAMVKIAPEKKGMPGEW